MITSPGNDKVKYLRSLYQRKQRLAEGRFIIEGARLIEDALAAGLTPDWVFAAQQLPSHARQTLHRLRARRIDVIDVSDTVFKACSDTETPQGLIAVLSMPQLTWPADPKLIVVVDALRDPGNLGTLLRSCAAADVDGVLLSPGTVDAYNPKVVRGAMGAHFRLPVREADWVEIIDRVGGRPVYVADQNGVTAYDAVDWTQPAALIIGSEAAGVSNEAAHVATARLSIPLARGVESLNAAVAASIIVFEARRQRR